MTQAVILPRDHQIMTCPAELLASGSKHQALTLHPLADPPWTDRPESPEGTPRLADLCQGAVRELVSLTPPVRS
jgi:hypothetical protein